MDWEFSDILEQSPVGDLCFGPYDIYIKTLMEVFSDEMDKTPELLPDLQDKLYTFQNRNAGILIKKLEKMKVAMLSDSVGLGKTITAGAVIRHYIKSQNARVRLIVPAGLKNQWEVDLEGILGIENHRDYQMLSMQDVHKLKETIDQDKQYFRRNKHVDLFVIDEAHNLRNTSGTRYEAVEEMLGLHPDSKVLLLTATPINNRLIDFSNQIMLASKGRLRSIPVPFYDNRGNLTHIDFFEALERISSEREKARRKKQKYDWSKNKIALSTGLRHYLVRTTRRGIQEESRDFVFPKSTIKSINYTYDTDINLGEFEDVDPFKININVLDSFTQLTKHPLDVVKDENYMNQIYKRSENEIITSSVSKEGCSLHARALSDANTTVLDVIEDNARKSVIVNIYQALLLLGLCPYRPDLYKHKFYGKSIDEINVAIGGRFNSESAKIRTQMSIHNIIHVSWLKRSESSLYALKKSLCNYRKRLDKFEYWLNKGYIISLKDISIIENQYDDNFEDAFKDYDGYNAEDSYIYNDIDSRTKGVERVEADENVFNIRQLRKDIERDRIICSKILESMDPLIKNNPKIQELLNFINEQKNEKVLIFSFFADTIEYLNQQLSGKLKNAEFLSGNSPFTESIVRKFSPQSKKYQLKENENEIQYLFATDILSEGQNLQDCGVLINYDLHWNPVRMIQRNGRINRLGSKFNEVIIANCKPVDDLEAYLNIVKRLEYKIEGINETIGLDQDVMVQGEANPMEFIEKAQEQSSVDGIAEAGEDLLSWSDDFIVELHKFIDNNDESEINRIRSIPLGKWNYLPANSSEDRVIGLEKVSLTKGEEKDSLSEYIFCKMKPVRYDADSPFAGLGGSDSIKGDFIETEIALNAIKTNPDDNSVSTDKIKLNRKEYSNRLKMVATSKAVNAEYSQYDLKLSEERAINIISEYFKDFNKDNDLRKIIKNSLFYRTDKKEFNKLVKLINEEYKDNQYLNASTQTKFANFYERLKDRYNKESREISSQKDILFYVPRSIND